ncbi:MAG: YbjN domain-containing protein, partial [Deinococcus sp.]|nr:YbjN domain-containing protein [Deinococcus sp.]
QEPAFPWLQLQVVYFSYNLDRRYRFSKAYLHAGKDPVLEADLCLAGVMPEVMADFVREVVIVPAFFSSA